LTITNRKRVLYTAFARLLARSPAMILADLFIPGAIANYLSENLCAWKEKGLLKSYRFRVERLSRLQYRIEVHVEADEKETTKMVTDYVSKLLGAYLKDFI
jgi:hypothetical protein